MRLRVWLLPSLCSTLIAHCLGKLITLVLPLNQHTQAVRETATANKEEMGIRICGCKATLLRPHLWMLLWRAWLLGKLYSKTYSCVLTTSRTYMVCFTLAWNGAALAQPGLHSLVLHTFLLRTCKTLVKRKIAVLFPLLKDTS